MIYITTSHEQGIKKRNEQDEAVGHFFLQWLSGPVLAQKYGLIYLHQDIIPQYIGDMWNQFLGFDFAHRNLVNNITQVLPKIKWPAKTDNQELFSFIRKISCSSISEESNIILVTSPGQSFEIDWSYYLNNNLRERYDFARQTNPVKLNNPDDYYIVCIHIRKGDINPKDQPERWMTNTQYYELIRNIENVLDSQYIRYQIQIISEGEKQDFGCLNDIDGLKFILNEDPKTSFHRMVVSDILVNAKSAFSVLAAYLHKGPKLCIPFSIYWNQTHPDNDNFKDLIWINNNMDFDNNKLKEVINV